MQFQDVAVFLVVGLAFVYLVRRLVLSLGKSKSCGDDCACSSEGVKRDPVIQKYLNKSDKDSEK